MTTRGSRATVTASEEAVPQTRGVRRRGGVTRRGARGGRQAVSLNLEEASSTVASGRQARGSRKKASAIEDDAVRMRNLQQERVQTAKVKKQFIDPLTKMYNNVR